MTSHYIALQALSRACGLLFWSLWTQAGVLRSRLSPTFGPDAILKRWRLYLVVAYRSSASFLSSIVYLTQFDYLCLLLRSNPDFLCAFSVILFSLL